MYKPSVPLGAISKGFIVNVHLMEPLEDMDFKNVIFSFNFCVFLIIPLACKNWKKKKKLKH